MKRVILLLALSLASTAIASDLKSINGSLPTGGETADFVFIAGGDNRPTAKGAPLPRVLPVIFEETRLIKPDLILWSGDTIYGYGDKPGELKDEYDAFVGLAARAGAPLFNAPGNHEIHDDDRPCEDMAPEQKFVSIFGGPYGSFDFRGAHFIALDTEECGHKQGKTHVIDGTQLDWLKKDLETNKTARAIFVFFHTEVTQATDDEDGGNHPPLGNSDKLRTLFEHYPVRAVFQGHEHLFYQTEINGIRYFVAGGAGAPMYAPPDKGGYSHYLVVEMKNDQLTYKVVEPGHLYVQAGKPQKISERMLWLINSSDLKLPVRRIETSVPDSFGKCDALTVESRLKSWDGTDIPVPLQITDRAKVNGKCHLTIALTDLAPKRSSVPIYVSAGAMNVKGTNNHMIINTDSVINQLFAGGTALAGLILVFLGGVLASFESYAASEQLTLEATQCLDNVNLATFFNKNKAQ